MRLAFLFSSKPLSAKTIYRVDQRQAEENLDQGALKFRSEKGLSPGQDLKTRNVGSVLALLCLCASERRPARPHCFPPALPARLGSPGTLLHSAGSDLQQDLRESQ